MYRIWYFVAFLATTGVGFWVLVGFERLISQMT
jgi:hypothetical protein